MKACSSRMDRAPERQARRREGPAAGRRAPNGQIARNRDVFSLIQGYRWHVLALSRRPLRDEIETLASELARIASFDRHPARDAHRRSLAGRARPTDRAGRVESGVRGIRAVGGKSAGAVSHPARRSRRVPVSLAGFRGTQRLHRMLDRGSRYDAESRNRIGQTP